VVIELAATADVPDFISERKLVRPGQTVRLRMNNLVTANRFQRRHRLRVIIIPQFSPLFSVNPQTGSLEFDTNSVRAGEIRIAHSADQPSRIVPPVVPVD
jgi:predicted acyl esterase